MATTVIKKQKTTDVATANISHDEIEGYDNGKVIVLTSAVKQAVNIKFDKYGHTNVSTVDLGVQYDHRVTWLHFDLDELLWNAPHEEADGDYEGKYTDRRRNNFYNFKLVFTRLEEDNTDGSSEVWEFEGTDFEIPRGITRFAGLYKIVLIIEEKQEGDQDNFQGNILDDENRIERFITQEFKGRVFPTFYKLTDDAIVEDIETDQRKALIKDAIKCTLTDTGEFDANTDTLGQQYDSYIRYLHFDPPYMTKHLSDFLTLAIFKKETSEGIKFYASKFEVTNQFDPYDDYNEEYPLIAWIPPEVMRYSGVWQVAVIGILSHDMEEVNDPNENNGNYYFFLSKTKRMKVVKNNLTEDLIKGTAIQALNSNFYTEDGRIILDQNNNVYYAFPEASEEEGGDSNVD